MPSRRTDFFLSAAIFVAGCAYFAAFSPWTRPVLLDAATWDYMALQVAQGLVPYRDIFLHKTPGGAFVGAAGAMAGSLLGIEPVLAAHALFLALGALGPVLLYRLCRKSMPRGAALASAVALLTFNEWVIAALQGCLPKIVTIVFGLASMLAAENGSALAASLWGGCSVLCWQPGLAFLVGAWVSLLRGGERGLLRWIAIGATSLLPSVLLLSWLAAHGALRDFFEQAVMFNFTYIHEKARPVFGTVRALVRTAGIWNDVELLLAPAALAGFALRSLRRDEATQWRFPLSMSVSAAIYLAMTFVSYQSWPDAMLFAPMVAALLGAGLFALLSTLLVPAAATSIAVIVLVLATIPNDRPTFHPPVDFATQRVQFRSLADGLTPADSVVAVSVPEFFIHTGRRNGWKWPYLWFGVDDFASDHHENGFQGILDDLDRDKPALILVARLWAGPQRVLFEKWAAARYDLRVVRLYPHTRKPLRVYRLRR
ncbi:MAG TPA: hypothetical protein VGK20_02760 [Candidatus Binatia bacterium]